MPISILPPQPAQYLLPPDPDSDRENEKVVLDEDGDFVRMISTPRKRSKAIPIVTPGEIVTSDPQWMRGHGTCLMRGRDSAVDGDDSDVNKLLSVKPLRARYTPEIGDLVVGRIAEVQSKRWKVDINSTLMAHLLLSSINLPGGILRKRTSTDELQIRSFFSEGDLLVAEVQSLFQDGAASLHTRSLKYGKLRNGYFLKVKAGGIVRGKSHIVTLEAANGAGEVDVILGVNGYVWVSKKVTLQAPPGGESITRLEEEASEAIYSNVNEDIAPVTRREIARVGNCVRAMVRWNVRVDEEVLNAVYLSALELEEMGFTEEGGSSNGPECLEGEVGRRAVEAGMERVREANSKARGMVE
ncbi:unnamed protein product [Tuber melanosporum]|uniref:(Perigord truffle) hypothetical protein n=1 Tax=Tuber melanosporum (strain Mel28) TaxID=656061 RepID=D5GK20_TUBMM|nr:uncharacterized protein GSTUM_00009327001 [Tuber melanosporum]CAZ84863.1 unnamed protein product [Tuber melanosporum]